MGILHRLHFCYFEEPKYFTGTSFAIDDNDYFRFSVDDHRKITTLNRRKTETNTQFHVKPHNLPNLSLYFVLNLTLALTLTLTSAESSEFL